MAAARELRVRAMMAKTGIDELINLKRLGARVLLNHCRHQSARSYSSKASAPPPPTPTRIKKPRKPVAKTTPDPKP